MGQFDYLFPPEDFVWQGYNQTSVQYGNHRQHKWVLVMQRVNDHAGDKSCAIAQVSPPKDTVVLATAFGHLRRRLLDHCGPGLQTNCEIHINTAYAALRYKHRDTMVVCPHSAQKSGKSAT